MGVFYQGDRCGFTKDPSMSAVVSHPLKPLNAWLSLSGYVNWLRKYTLVLLNFRIPKTFKLLFCKFFHNLQINNGKTWKMAAFTGYLRYSYCRTQGAEHRQSIIFRFLFVVKTTQCQWIVRAERYREGHEVCPMRCLKTDCSVLIPSRYSDICKPIKLSLICFSNVSALTFNVSFFL